MMFDKEEYAGMFDMGHLANSNAGNVRRWTHTLLDKVVAPNLALLRREDFLTKFIKGIVKGLGKQSEL
jgi:hypothetical protein